jgi:flagellar basal-body rod modification protein FlgD
MIAPALAASAVAAAASFLMPDRPPAAAPKPNDLVNQAEFMKLLIAQLQNQDPLNPLDSANFSAQLAQFSSLEQLTQINQRLAAQTNGAGGTGRFDAVSFLGKDVSGVSDVMTVTNGVASPLDYELGIAGVVQAKIYDAGGREVASLTLGAQGPGAHHFDLASVPAAPVLANGSYRVQLSVVDPSGTATPIETRVGGRVTGVDLASDPPVLLIGERRLGLGDVREVREIAEESGAA